MEDRNRQIDDYLDQGLKLYAEVEPRAGLEGRLLAAVRAEQHQTSYNPFRRIAIATVVLAAAVYLVRRPPAHNDQTVSIPKPGAHESLGISAKPIPPRSDVIPKRRQRKNALSRIAEPRLDQFPSPQPLNEQEEMLVRYVRERRREAIMVARAQAELKDGEFLSAAEQLPLVRSIPEFQQ